MLSIALRYSGNEEDAQDIVHDTIMRLIHHLDKLNGAPCDSARNYVCRAVEHMGIDFLRKKNRHQTDDIEEHISLADTSLPMLDVIMSDEYVALVVKCINQMNDTYRSVCQLRFMDDKSEKEIAALLNLPPKTVNVRIVRGRQKLIAMINKERNHEEK